MGRPAVLLAALVLASCAPGSAGLWPVPWAIASGSGRDARAPGIPAIVGRVEMGDMGRSVQATVGDVAVGATVSLVDSTTSSAIATTLSDGNGAFVLSFGSFVPVTNRIYLLEAIKGLGPNAVGKNAARVRTLVRFGGTGWQSITAGGISLSRATTALCGIYGLKLALSGGQQVSPAELIGSYDGFTYTPVANASAAEFNQALNLVTAMLAADLDPLANLAYDAGTGQFRKTLLGNLAPDDPGDPAVHHDYVVTKGGVQSTFVWIPLFTAYQLIVPASCGADNADKPVGYWVANQPTTGTRDADWAEERFGGFYAGKYEASRSDATPGDPTTGTGATAGTGSTLKVARYCVLWGNMDWDAAASTCLAFDAHAHLMRDDEWTALAVWATINGVSVAGNTDSRKDSGDPAITFLEDPFGESQVLALTGSATKSTWAGTTNFSTHTGLEDGVFDLHGNAWEWTETVGLEATTGKYLLNDLTMPVVAPGTNFVSALATDLRLRRLGLPGVTQAAVNSFWGATFAIDTAARMKTLRGGAWNNAAGIWGMALVKERTWAHAVGGFRPALRY
ncbi:MAG: hypothetical protein FJZ01_00970 [Candidatus Sericytochromatia bacterium]|nr:hypothetical protein [Candidatus Tanganyikabacteria bacterium]